MVVPGNKIFLQWPDIISISQSHSFFLCFYFVLALSSGDECFSEWKRTDSNSEAMKHEHCLFSRLCPLLVIRLLPLRVFDDLNSHVVYGEIPHNSAVHGMFLLFNLFSYWFVNDDPSSG